jgi:glucose-1-phosphate thymidylyltransferase
MKGIVLAGGSGNRLYPLSVIQTKQLQPVYDKPMIYYPLSLLMLCGIKDILIITTEQDLSSFKKLLGEGENLGLNLTYKIQERPNGIAEAFVLGEEFIGDDDVALILGDNLFYGDFHNFKRAVHTHINSNQTQKAKVFAYAVSDPERYGVVEFERSSMKVLSLEEKPSRPKSNYAVPGFYLFDSGCVKKSKELAPSKRGELEITDLIDVYHKSNSLSVELINRGVAWFDTGTPQSLLDAGSFIGAIEERQGVKVACLEEIALRMDFITLEMFQKNIDKIPECTYRQYLELIKREKEVL